MLSVDGLSHHLLLLPQDDSSDPIHILSSPFPFSFILHLHPSHFLLTSSSLPTHFLLTSMVSFLFMRGIGCVYYYDTQIRHGDDRGA